MILYNIFCLINPGGAREIEHLTKFVREPVGPGDAAGVREMLEDWVVARRRLKVVGNLDMIPKERFDAMSLMVEKLCTKDQKFNRIWETKCALLGPGCHDHVNDQFADNTKNWLRHELKGMESNEILDLVQNKGDTGWGQWSPSRARVMKMAATEGDKEARRKNYVCYNWKKDGKCSRPNCPFSHDPTTWTEFVPREQNGAGRGATPTATVKMVAVIKLSVPINEVTIFNDRENDGALLDSGASEVVRPYISGWHQDIKVGRCRGRDVPVCLAGGVEKTGVMTGTGVLMIPRERGEVQG